MYNEAFEPLFWLKISMLSNFTGISPLKTPSLAMPNEWSVFLHIFDWVSNLSIFTLTLSPPWVFFHSRDIDSFIFLPIILQQLREGRYALLNSIPSRAGALVSWLWEETHIQEGVGIESLHQIMVQHLSHVPTYCCKNCNVSLKIPKIND